mmetsp:Transcript_17725/g.41224  ORF Transcript_17725/g.41224 Transcript_17725/m.41224 type:complete len:275 (-) Transcript_17725:23-847(-)
MSSSCGLPGKDTCTMAPAPMPSRCKDKVRSLSSAPLKKSRALDASTTSCSARSLNSLRVIAPEHSSTCTCLAVDDPCTATRIRTSKLDGSSLGAGAGAGFCSLGVDESADAGAASTCFSCLSVFGLATPSTSVLGAELSLLLVARSLVDFLACTSALFFGSVGGLAADFASAFTCETCAPAAGVLSAVLVCSLGAVVLLSAAKRSLRSSAASAATGATVERPLPPRNHQAVKATSATAAAMARGRPSSSLASEASACTFSLNSGTAVSMPLLRG